MENKTIFETGATTEDVNDLILYVDTTKTLALLRDNIYKERCFNKPGKQMNFKEINPINFKLLLDEAIKMYMREFKYEQWKRIRYLPIKKRIEFCKLYANDFHNWKKEHNYK